MKKSKRKPTKAELAKQEHERLLLSAHVILEDLVVKLNGLGDFDANAPHVRSLAWALALLYRDHFDT